MNWDPVLSDSMQFQPALAAVIGKGNEQVMASKTERNVRQTGFCRLPNKSIRCSRPTVTSEHHGRIDTEADLLPLMIVS